MIVCALTTMRVAILIGIDSNIQSFLKKKNIIRVQTIFRLESELLRDLDQL